MANGFEREIRIHSNEHINGHENSVLFELACVHVS